MPYNKARAEKEWLTWKMAEEVKLRELGVDEETIQRLHTYDWMEFQPGAPLSAAVGRVAGGAGTGIFRRYYSPFE